MRIIFNQYLNRFERYFLMMSLCLFIFVVWVPSGGWIPPWLDQKHQSKLIWLGSKDKALACSREWLTMALLASGLRIETKPIRAFVLSHWCLFASWKEHTSWTATWWCQGCTWSPCRTSQPDLGTWQQWGRQFRRWWEGLWSSSFNQRCPSTHQL